MTTSLLNKPLNFTRENDAEEILARWDQALHAVYKISDLSVFPAASLDSLLALVCANAGSFFLWDETRKEFTLHAARGPYRERMQKTHVKLREGILGWVGIQGMSLLVKDVRADERLRTLKRYGYYKSLSFISVPLVFNNQLLGVVNITEREDLMAFSEEDLNRAQSFCRHIASAYGHLKNSKALEADNKGLHEKLSHLTRIQKEIEPFTALGKMTAELAHELNNPLDAIRRYVNLALEHSLQDSVTREYLTKAKKSIRRSVRTARNLLQFMSSFKETSVSRELHELIDLSLEVAEDPAFEKIDFRRDYGAGPSFISDRGLILVLQNLFQNARQAMRGTGTIKVSTYREDPSVIILVEDTGSGIPKDIQPRLFEPFFSTKARGEGTGIGLALCREIVERCGGMIHCDFSSEHGARFVITLPCARKGESV